MEADRQSREQRNGLCKKRWPSSRINQMKRENGAKKKLGIKYDVIGAECHFHGNGGSL